MRKMHNCLINKTNFKENQKCQMPSSKKFKQNKNNFKNKNECLKCLKDQQKRNQKTYLIKN